LAEKPRLVVVIDTEEEFDWGGKKSRQNTSVRSMRWISRISAIFDEYGITPVYVIDYPVVSQVNGYRPLQDLYMANRCLIGAHLHPWVNPPFEEPVNAYNSFPGNLGHALEAAKLKVLTDMIAEHFGARPIIYKAGRYGIGSHTASILEEQGYEIDMSVCPHMNYSAEGGPDFSTSCVWPYWFGRGLLELPLTIGFAGLLRQYAAKIHRASISLTKFHAPGVLARLGLLNKIWLSPEGYRLSEMIALSRALYDDGLRIFSFAFHSPSLDWGNTPYVKSQGDLRQFLDCCRRFFEFFIENLGGIPATPLEIKARLAATAPQKRGSL
jgi:hypothetical protein